MEFYVFQKLGRIDSNGAHTCHGENKRLIASFPSYALAEKFIRKNLANYFGDMAVPHAVYKIYVKDRYRFKPVSNWYF